MRQVTRLAALACALIALPVVAQDTTGQGAAVTSAGATSISLGVGGGSSIGVWRELSPRVRAGVDVGVHVGRTEGDDVEQRLSGISVQPSIMLFSRAPAAFRPYTELGVYAQQTRSRSEGEDPQPVVRTHSRALGALAGVGLEWMPISRVAVRGHVGLAGEYGDQRTEVADDTQEQEGWTLRTFNSGVVLHLFF